MSPKDVDAAIEEAKDLICDMCRNFYTQGWCSGSGGGISIKACEDRIVMAPSGVQKERMLPSDMFVLDGEGNVLHTPVARPAPYKPPKLSECSPLFMSAYELRGAGAVLHSHSTASVLATLIDQNASEFRITQMEMMKGIEGHGFYDELVVPIIENTARESQLTERLRAAIKAYPKANAVLVRRHGVYIWGKTWIQAKTQAECYDYLFDAAVRMKQMGIDPTNGPCVPTDMEMQDVSEAACNALKKRKANAISGSISQAYLVLDIEGTTSPISFVSDVMFPYAKKELRAHLQANWSSKETQEDVAELIKQAAKDVEDKLEGAYAVSNDIDSVVAYTESLMAKDRKVGALKQLQGHIWRQGFAAGDLQGKFFDDVPATLKKAEARGIKTYIYSSGSREAQRMFFGHTVFGDLRQHLSGFFDTTSGMKIESSSYKNIQMSLGCDEPSNITFATDLFAEAKAAREAGWEAVLVLRPGNKPLPAEHETSGIRTITSLAEIL